MASVVCVCAVVLLAAVVHATNIVKGLYCQDPDTRKLYPVNTTWPSQTFCGNYTCKLRKRNITETEYTPVKKIDITNLRIPNEEDNISNDMTTSPSDTSFVLTTKTDNDIQPIFHKNMFKATTKEPLPKIKNSNEEDEYLTESEIKVITDMLHTIKRSDLEAIVDIYNLAQDIYKEIDNNNKPNQVKELKHKSNTVKPEKIDGQQSYWYDPLQYHNKVIDMSHEQTKIVSTKKPSSDSNPTFFKAPLSTKDFGKLPYYYPMSNFQRLSSYTHHKPNTLNDLERAPTETKPCSKAPNNNKNIAVPEYNVPVKNPGPIATVKSSTLLPYPFSYIYHYNVSGYPPNYYYNYPWTNADYNRYKSYPQPYYGTYVVQIPSYSPYRKSNVPENKESSELNISEGEFLDRLIKPTLEKQSLPDWQTEPLSEQVLEEVRAHLEKPKSLKSAPLKKSVKLERIGKVIKLDELTRARRAVDSNNIEDKVDKTLDEKLETYIERTTCENNTELGYFRIGNMSAPYPACCPQKLDKITTHRTSINKN